MLWIGWLSMCFGLFDGGGVGEAMLGRGRGRGRVRDW